MNIDNIMNPEEKQFIDDIYSIVAYVKEYAYKSVNVAQVVTNWLIGKRIVEQEKRGKGRANYGMHVVKLVSESLTNEFGVGYSITNVKSFVKFFRYLIIWQLGRCRLPKMKWIIFLEQRNEMMF